MSQKHNGKASMGHQSHDNHDNKIRLAVLRVSSIPAPEKVLAFFKSIYFWCLRECSSSNIDAIFGENGSSGEYPVFECPVDPDSEDRVAVKKWDHAYGRYMKQVDALIADKQKLYGTILQQMSHESFVVVQENPEGSKAMQEKCPKKLIAAIILTHMSDSKVSTQLSLFQATQIYQGPTNRMGNSSLSDYYTKFKSLLENIRMSSNRVSTEDFMDESVPGDLQQALKFLDGLNNKYDPMMEIYNQSLKEWPVTLGLAYSDASNFKIKENKQNPLEKEIMITNKKLAKEKKNNNKDGKPSGNKKNTNIYGGRIGTCNKCGMEGHYLYECKEPVKGEGKQSKGGEANPKAV